MYAPDTMAMLGFNLKLIAGRSKKNILVSTGTTEVKKRLLPAIVKLADTNINLFATDGTHRFLVANGVTAQLINKISDTAEPNIRSFLEQDRFDLIINILTGDSDYDESSDSKLIRTLAIENGIPLITDPDVALLTIAQLVDNRDRGVYRYKLADKSEPWDLRKEFFQKVSDLGGMTCNHAHLDKAYLISRDNLQLSHPDMQQKWRLYRYRKENYTHEDLVERMSRGVEMMLSQGVVALKTFVDADAIVGLLPMIAAQEVKKRYADRILIEVGVQPLEGLIDPEARKNFIKACELADFVGALPSKDRPQPEKHLDIAFGIAKDLGLPLEAHVDQENNPYESETELLAVKAIEHGMEGRVAGIHAISISAKHEAEQDRIIQKVKDAGMTITICPSAALSMRQLSHISAPLHNSIGPFVKMLDAGVDLNLGADNIADLFMPFVDGDMWVECRLLMEAARYYEFERLAEVACSQNGFRRNERKR